MEYNRMIQSQVEHLDNLLKSLVNITFNKSEPVYETIDFRKEVEVILRELRHSRRSEGSVFTVRIPCIHGHRLV